MTLRASLKYIIIYVVGVGGVGVGVGGVGIGFSGIFLGTKYCWLNALGKTVLILNTHV